MSSEFKATSITLLKQIAMEKTGDDESAWVRFWELYQPAMLVFARSLGGGDEAEDIVQDVLAKLVDVLRHGRYERQDGSMFRSYLKTLIRRQLVDVYRRGKARGSGRNVELTEDISDSVASETAEVGHAMDCEWAEACRNAVIEHVMTKTALSAQSKAVYRAYVLNGRDIGDVADEFGVSRNLVSQIKTRIDRMIEDRMSEYGG